MPKERPVPEQVNREEKQVIILHGHMKRMGKQTDHVSDDPLAPEVEAYLNKFDFPLAYLIQRKFKIGFTRAERILKQIEAKRSKKIT